MENSAANDAVGHDARQSSINGFNTSWQSDAKLHFCVAGSSADALPGLAWFASG